MRYEVRWMTFFAWSAVLLGSWLLWGTTGLGVTLLVFATLSFLGIILDGL